MRPSVRLVPLVVALAAAAVFGVPSEAQPLSGAVEIDLAFGAKPSLRVTTLSASSGGAVSVYGGSGSVSSEQPVPPAQVVVDLARGYAVTPVGVGSTAGLANVTSISGGASSASLAAIIGALTADDPGRYASDPAAKACAPGPYTAVWRLDATIFGLSLTVPIFVGHPAADANVVELRFCPPPLTDATGKPVTASPVPLTGVSFLLTGLSGPAAHGSYMSSALITPMDGSGAAAPSSTVEARSLDPIPHTLTLSGRYDAKHRSALLSGRVTELGKPQPRALVEYFCVDSFSEPKHVRASARGTFATRVRIDATTRFAALVPDATVACSGSSSAPLGCASTTVIGSNSRVVRVVVPR